MALGIVIIVINALLVTYNYNTQEVKEITTQLEIKKG